jgi:acyl-CoA synthetase (AMP-forming)/AMP-acid ligase II
MFTVATNKYSMLFTKFLDTAKKYQTKLAINNLTYDDVVNLVQTREYCPVCYSTDYTVILDILKAASINKPIVILPKFKRDEVIIPELQDNFGIYLFSSGSTGKRKSIFLSEEMILANSSNAIECQTISEYDNILTVCSLNHTGGLNAQTIPGLLIGAHIIVEEFNAFNFFKKLQQHQITLTHLIPLHIDALIKVKSKIKIDHLRLVVAGSDCVYLNQIKFWLELDTEFMVNYGLTEAGPIILNHTFNKTSDLSVYDHGVVLGNTTWCEYKIIDGELFLKGNSVNTNDWLATGDCVEKKDNWILYRGRKSAGCKIIPKQY